MKSFKKEFLTIALLLVVALFGAYVVNAAPTPEQLLVNESVSPNVSTEFLPLAVEFGEINAQESETGFLIAVSADPYPECGTIATCADYCDEDTINDWFDGDSNACQYHCTQNCL